MKGVSNKEVAGENESARRNQCKCATTSDVAALIVDNRKVLVIHDILVVSLISVIIIRVLSVVWLISFRI